MNEKSEERPGHGAPPGSIPEHRYRKPPVVEALCEIYFADSEWDDTVPGAFYEKVKKDFPNKQQRPIQEAQITLGPEQAAARVRQLPPWMQFVSEEKHRMIQVARNLLVVNQLAPYPHFEEWEPEIYRYLSIYQTLARPEKTVRLGVRYINRVVIPQERVQMEDYFTIHPNLPERLGTPMVRFWYGWRFPKWNRAIPFSSPSVQRLPLILARPGRLSCWTFMILFKSTNL